jgi:hypothetical protein
LRISHWFGFLAVQESEQEEKGQSARKRTMGDWMRLAALSERLGYAESAYYAYRSCLAQYPAIRAWFDMLELCASEARVLETFVCVLETGKYLSSRPHFSGAYRRGQLHSALSRIVSKYGMAAVKSQMSKVRTGMK